MGTVTVPADAPPSVRAATLLAMGMAVAHDEMDLSWSADIEDNDAETVN